MKYQDFFKNKKVTVMGLGLLGRGVGDSKFLAEQGAELIITDLKTKDQLEESLKQLGRYKNITYVLGEHRLEDFRNRDFILKAAGVPLDSPYIAEARKNNIPIEMSSALFAAFTQATIVGITGTRGKSTVTQLLYTILKAGYEKLHRGKVFLGGNIRGIATLPLLIEAKRGDISVLELDSWQLQGFNERKISPHIGIFTNFMNDHLNYYRGNTGQYFEDKAAIFKHQRQNDYLITGTKVAHLITARYFGKLANDPIAVSAEDVSHDWKIKLIGEHNLDNISCAIRAAEIIGVPSTIIKKTVEEFTGIPGRLEFVREYKHIKIYNDTNSTTPDATRVALKALSKSTAKPQEKNIILIMGGAEKNLDMTDLMKELSASCKYSIFMPGTGTDALLANYKDILLTYSNNYKTVTTLEEAVSLALTKAQAGDSILFSPAFASFGMFINEYDRGDQFNALIYNLR